VAAKAISDALGLPRRLASVLDGEGLVNDATALVAFQLASGVAITGAAFTLPSATVQLLFAAASSVAIGASVGWLGRKVLNQLQDSAVENTVILILPFAVFLAAERVHASGVLAVLTLALYQSRFGVVESSSLSRLEGRVLWDMINFVLTGVSFVLVGLQLPPVIEGVSGRIPTVALATLAVCLTVILVRPLWIFGVAWLSHGVRTVVGESTALSTRPSRGVLAVISWAGMRGVISLALALSLPLSTDNGQPFPDRSLIVVITFAVVLVTLLGQGLSLPSLIRVLKVRSVFEHVEDQDYAVQLRMARAALDRLDRIAGTTKAEPAAVERVRAFYAARISRLARGHEIATGTSTEKALNASVNLAAQDLLGKLLEIEHRELQALLKDGFVEAHLARQIQARLDALRHLDQG
jgi:CPA1 family monovalent cation:H+ antiporter